MHNGTHSPPFKADSSDLITSGWIEWWFHGWCKRSVATKTTQLSHASCSIQQAAQTIHCYNNNTTFRYLVLNSTGGANDPLLQQQHNFSISRAQWHPQPPFQGRLLGSDYKWKDGVEVPLAAQMIRYDNNITTFPCLVHIPRAAQTIRCENNNTTFPCLAHNGTHSPYKAGSSDLITSGWIEWWFHRKRSVATTTTQLSHGSCTMAPTALSRQAARI